MDVTVPRAQIRIAQQFPISRQLLSASFTHLRPSSPCFRRASLSTLNWNSLDPASWVRFDVRIFQREPPSGGLDFGTRWDIWR
jgi:hypothetical protein